MFKFCNWLFFCVFLIGPLVIWALVLHYHIPIKFWHGDRITAAMLLLVSSTSWAYAYAVWRDLLRPEGAPERKSKD